MAKSNSSSKYSQLFAICKAHGFEYKEKVYEFTNGRTTSLTALSEIEYTSMMKLLIDLNEPLRRDWVPKPGDPQRKKLFAIARLMKYGDNRTIFSRLDQWARKQKYKKSLMQHNPAELDLLVTIFEQRVYTHYLTTLNEV